MLVYLNLENQSNNTCVRAYIFIWKALRAWQKSLAQLRMHSRLMHQTFAWNSATCRQEMLTISIYCLSIQARNPAKAKPEVPSKEPKFTEVAPS